MKIIWSPQAIEDLRRVYLYIAEDNPYAARLIQIRIKEHIASLQENPHIGRPGRVPDTRELVIPGTPYTAPYRVKEGRIEILRIYHSARKWPDSI